jgi:hypothetical protein
MNLAPSRVYFVVSSSLKNETIHKNSSLKLIKNEIHPPSIESSISLDLVNIESSLSLDLVNVESSLSLDLIIEPSFHLPMLVDPLSSSGEHLPISNQESSRVHKLVTT